MKIINLNLLMLLFCVQIYSQNDAEKIFSTFKDKFNNIQDFWCDFSQTAYSNFGDSYYIEGKFYYKKKNKFLIETAQAKIFSDGKDLYNLDLSSNRIIINSLKNSPNAPIIDKIIEDVAKKSKKEIVEQSENLIGILLKPTTEEYNVQEIELYFNKDFIPQKFIIKDYLDNVYEIVFKNHSVNINLSENLFKFEKKYGIEVVDLR